MRTFPYTAFTLFILASSGCDQLRDILDPGTGCPCKITLTVDKTEYSPQETVVVTLYNDSKVAVFLEGCNPIYLATQADSGWTEATMRVCVWEGFARKINPNEVYQENYEARIFSSVHKFVAPVYWGCLEGKPISQAQCKKSDKIFSETFSVTGFGNATGNLSIRTQKWEYTWGTDDLGTSRQIEAALINISAQTLYANLGDGFDSSIEQDNLFIAEGTGGFVEQSASNGVWTPMPRGILIEGSRFVALPPNRSYRLLAYLPWNPTETGTFRLRVEYFNQITPPPGTEPMNDFSNIFSIY